MPHENDNEICWQNDNNKQRLVKSCCCSVTRSHSSDLHWVSWYWAPSLTVKICETSHSQLCSSSPCISSSLSLSSSSSAAVPVSSEFYCTLLWNIYNIIFLVVESKHRCFCLAIDKSFVKPKLFWPRPGTDSLSICWDGGMEESTVMWSVLTQQWMRGVWAGNVSGDLWSVHMFHLFSIFSLVFIRNISLLTQPFITNNTRHQPSD